MLICVVALKRTVFAVWQYCITTIRSSLGLKKTVSARVILTAVFLSELILDRLKTIDDLPLNGRRYNSSAVAFNIRSVSTRFFFKYLLTKDT